MSLFVCSKCGCIDNTATSYYWALIRPCKNRIYDKSLKGYEGKPLCSECAAIEYSKGGEVVVVPGTWHGKFKKEWPTEEEKKHIRLGRGLANQIKINKTIPVSHKPKEERRMMFVCGDDIASLIKRFENESK